MPHVIQYKSHQLKTRLKLRAGFISALLLLATIGFISENRIERSVEDAGWVLHTDEVLLQLQGVSEGLSLAQKEERGYILNPNKTLAESFQDDEDQTTAHLIQVRRLTADNPRQQQRLDRLKPLMEQSRAAEEAAIVAARSSGEKAAVTYAPAIGADDQIMKRIEILLHEMSHEEQSLLQVRFQSYMTARERRQLWLE
jgi:methyl-accepting chemotaxis protein